MNHLVSIAQPSRRPRRRAPLGLAIAAALLVTVSLPSVALGWTDYTFSSSSASQMIKLINQARASAHLPALTADSSLTSVARWRSKDMYDRNYFSHTIPSPPGGNVFDELKRRGICYTTAGENIGSNDYPDDVATQTMFNGWMNSSGHRAIILGAGFNHVGIGAFKGTGSDYPNHLWTAVFTHPCGSSAPRQTPKPTPKPTPRTAPTPKPTPHATPRPTAEVVADATAEVTPEITLEPTAAPTVELLGGTDYPIWLDSIVLEGFDNGITPTSDYDPRASGLPWPAIGIVALLGLILRLGLTSPAVTGRR